MLDELKELYEIYSVSSCEQKLNLYLKSKYEDISDEIVEDRLYSVFAKKEAENKNKVMIACAMDEIGLMVNRIFENGEVNFICLEKLSPASLLHQRVNIITRENKNIKGVITTRKKTLEESISSIKTEDLYIDIFENKEDVNVGDLVTLDAELIETKDSYIGRSLNQKVPQLLSIKVLEELKDEKLNNTLFIGTIAQSTVGFRGTKTANHVVEPDLAIVVTGFEVNDSSPKVGLGDGVIVGYYDSQMLPNQDLLRYITDNYETKAYIGMLGNDGSFIHKTLGGAPTISVGIPMKNMGTSSVSVDKNDINKLKDFLVNICKDKKINKLIRKEK